MNYSPAETDVIVYLKQGYSNADIAHQLCVCEKTVKFHLTNIFKKANVKSRAEFITLDTREEKEVVMKELSKTEKLPTQAITQQDKIRFIDEQFKVGDAITQLHSMMKSVTKDQINPATVNAACNCVARLNETINTAIQAAKFLNER